MSIRNCPSVQYRLRFCCCSSDSRPIIPTMPCRTYTLFLSCVFIACSKTRTPSDLTPVQKEATHRVVVVHPEKWSAGEYRNCYLGSNDVVHNNLPQLDCDVEAHETPRSRMFVMDVEFSGDYKLPTTMAGTPEQAWTCQRTEPTVICRR